MRQLHRDNMAWHPHESIANGNYSRAHTACFDGNTYADKCRNLSGKFKRTLCVITGRAIGLISILFILSSCSLIYYPASPNTPLFKKSGQYLGEGRITTSGAELKAGYAITGNFMIAGMGTLLYRGKEGHVYHDLNDNNEYPIYHYYTEASVGFYHRPSEWFAMENLAGLGKGSGQGYRSIPREFKQGNYLKPFIQNNLAITSSTVAVDI